MREPDSIGEMKRILEAALLTSPQPLALDDLLKLFAGRMERATRTTNGTWTGRA